MQCFHPVQAFRCLDGAVVFQERSGRDTVETLQLRCGRCVGCRLERSRQWAVRCIHEAALHEDNCFITLTYDEFHVAPSLVYRDFQLFMKRLRKRAPGVRFFMCGEYGDEGGRPHFHACLFGYRFPDQVFFMESGAGSRVYTSALLSRLWPLGFTSIGDVTFESAAYVARYVMKKITGDAAAEHYKRVDEDTGEVVDIVPEFCHMSLKPGIGAGWFDKFHTDVYPRGYCVVNGVRVSPPKYYDRRYKRFDDDGFADLSMRRDQLARSKYLDNTDERLVVKEVVAEATVSFLKRGL